MKPVNRDCPLRLFAEASDDKKLSIVGPDNPGSFLRYNAPSLDQRMAGSTWAVDPHLARKVMYIWHFRMIGYLTFPNYWISDISKLSDIWHFHSFFDLVPFHPCKQTQYAGRTGSRQRRKPRVGFVLICTHLYSFVLIYTHLYSFVLFGTHLYSDLLICIILYSFVLICTLWYKHCQRNN